MAMPRATRARDRAVGRGRHDNTVRQRAGGPAGACPPDSSLRLPRKRRARQESQPRSRLRFGLLVTAFAPEARLLITPRRTTDSRRCAAQGPTHREISVAASEPDLQRAHFRLPGSARVARRELSAHTTVLILSGELDHPVRSLLVEQLGRARDAAALVIDLTGCEFLDSTIIRTLLAAKDASQTSSVVVVIPPEGSIVYRTLSLVRIGDFFSTYSHLEDAIAAAEPLAVRAQSSRTSHGRAPEGSSTNGRPGWL
jgi:anti-anti-sigma factor